MAETPVIYYYLTVQLLTFIVMYWIPVCAGRTVGFYIHFTVHSSKLMFIYKW